MLSRFHLIPERYGQTDRRTDGQTDRFAISIWRVSMLTRDKNRFAAYFLGSYNNVEDLSMSVGAHRTDTVRRFGH